MLYISLDYPGSDRIASERLDGYVNLAASQAHRVPKLLGNDYCKRTIRRRYRDVALHAKQQDG